MRENTINDGTTLGPDQGVTLANRYRSVRALGQGGMGSVWLAEDTKLDNRRVAIKMLPSILVGNRRAYRQIKDEALLSLKLSHPNIVSVRAFEEDRGNPFLVMDYVDGQTLDDCLAEKGRLTEEETRRLLAPVASALDYAHGEGVVHRDVKPGNVMIRSRDGHPFILDFGIAREIQETLTRVTGKLSSGTLLYMSPEQLHGAEPTAAQDVYSFAAMVYECLTGHPPFWRGQIEYQIDHDMPAPLAAGITMGGSVLAGLAKKPEERPATCAAVLAPWREPEGLYKVIDLTTGTVTYLDAVPPGGWTDAYKTSKIVLRRIEPGTFTMGSPSGEEGRFDGEVQHRVTLTKPFYIGVFAVTQAQWERVMGTNPSHFKGASRPVEEVSWEDCREFCEKAGLGLRLPTEAEWEYACRAGTTTAYFWGNALNGDRANCDGSWPCGTTAKGPYKEETCAVGSYAPNAWGLYDMHGNVDEWCADWYGAYGGAATDPTSPASGGNRVCRGGGWNDNAGNCRSADRSYDGPGDRDSSLGFRLACSAGPSE